KVWNFTVAGYLTVDDFDSYADDAAIKAVWKDYWADTASKNGAEVFVETDVNYIHSGQAMRYYYTNYKQISSQYVGSEAEAATADLTAIGSDWTIGSAEALVVYFIGDPCNGKDTTGLDQDQMYVAVEDGDTDVGVVELADMNNIKENWWHEWNIELDDPRLSSVSMNNVAKVYIGFGGYAKTGQSAAGAGMTYGAGDIVYFDDIRLYPARCRPEIAYPEGSFDRDDDCVINYRDLHELAGNDWLTSGIGNVTATAPSGPNLVGHWAMDDAVKGGGAAAKVVEDTGVTGSYDGTLYDPDADPGVSTDAHHIDNCVEGTGALIFDGYDDYIEIPTLDLNSNTVTVSAWIRRDGVQEIYAGIVDCHYSDPCDSNVPGTFFGIDIGSGGTYGFMDWGAWEKNNELCYFWGDIDLSAYDYDYSYDFHSGLIVPDKLWTFVALSVGPTEATLYLDDGTFQGARLNTPHNPLPFNGPAHFGDQMQDPTWDRYFKGAMDDIRIYDYTLTPGEILYLSQGASSNAYVTLPMGRPDADGDNKIDLKDYSVMANNWLETILWPEP
ncbi:MAG: LamG domain-containing protein, partial [Planctomycetota bacterium]